MHQQRPSWSLLYAIVAVLVAVLAVIEADVGEGTLRTVLEAVTAVVGFGLIELWLHANRVRLEIEKGRRHQ